MRSLIKLRRIAQSCSLCALLVLEGNGTSVSADVSQQPAIPTNPNQTISSGCRPVMAFGAANDGSALATVAINEAIQECNAKGGGTVRVDAGIYLTGTIRLLDNITLDLEPGSIIWGTSNLADYPRLDRASEYRDTALIVAENVHNVAVIGQGVIDGNGRAFIDNGQSASLQPTKPLFTPSFDSALTRQGAQLVSRMGEYREGPLTMLPRPGVLILALHVDGIQLHDFHVVDSPNWGIKLMCSKHIAISGVNVRNSLLIPNDDALDISNSTDATVSDSYLEAGDDALVIGGPCADGWCQETASNIQVNNVTLVSRSAAIRVGPDAKGVHDVTISNVIIRDSNRAIAVQKRTSETVENIFFSNIVIETRFIDGPWWGMAEPISISAAKWDYASWTPSTESGKIKNIHFYNVAANSQAPVVIYSSKPGLIDNIDFHGLSLTMQSGPLTTVFGGNLDIQPTAPSNLGLTKQDLSAVWARNVNNLSFEDLQVQWSGTFPDYYQSALDVEGFSGFSLDGFRGTASDSRFHVLKLANGSDASIHNANATDGHLLDAHHVKHLHR